MRDTSILNCNTVSYVIDPSLANEMFNVAWLQNVEMIISSNLRDIFTDFVNSRSAQP